MKQNAMPNAMSDDEIQVYLSEALDQEACRDTLIAALQSRVEALQAMGITTTRILNGLECLDEDPYQINGDIIFYVMELIIIQST